MTRLLFGFEGRFKNKNYISAAIFGAEKNHILMKNLMSYYEEKEEVSYEHKDNNSFVITNILEKKYGLNPNNEEQYLNEGIHVYNNVILTVPSKYSKTIHLVTATWNKKALPKKDKIIKRVLSYCNTKYKLKIYIGILNIYHKLKNKENKK